MTRIVGIAGSLRRGSYNAALLRAATQLAPEPLHIDIASIRDVPVYDGDIESEQGIPAAVAEIKNRIAAAQGLLIATPEYNGSIPGPLKNALDWLSRPSADIAKVFRAKPVGVIGATPGMLGTALAQTALFPVWRALAMRPYLEHLLYVPHAGKVFDDNGQLVDDGVRERLKAYLEGFSAFVNSH